ncbi:MAG: YbjN domain-containing protein [bacterium]|nr:YbjN domain-containing protein [bacterium]MDE0667509.1 YbjN domain-containing protein [bacterium]MXZ30055.1 YbjN domain-containing protein [Acidimicrobiia bacterium]MYB25792.1 YbjN domain-containing protein [Acidimicrobiia bacterium]
MRRRPATPTELDEIEGRIDAWAARQAAQEAAVASVERAEPPLRRWYIRLVGEEKSVFSVWFTLRQRSLHFETYFVPAPEENSSRLYEYCLRQNLKLRGARFAIGAEDAVFLLGEIAVADVADDELDRILGTVYEATERHFRPAMRIGFASRFRG